MENEVKIELRGDIRGAGQLERMNRDIREAYDKSGGNLLIDLSGLTALDYDAVTALLSIRNEKPAGTLHIRNVPEVIERIIGTFHIPV